MKECNRNTELEQQAGSGLTIRNSPSIYLEALNKRGENLIQDRLFGDCDLNLDLQNRMKKYKPLNLDVQSSVCCPFIVE
jgi:hypothetical protein